MPVADLLVLVPDIQQARLVKIIADYLQANRQAIALRAMLINRKLFIDNTQNKA